MYVAAAAAAREEYGKPQRSKNIRKYYNVIFMWKIEENSLDGKYLALNVLALSHASATLIH